MHVIHQVMDGTGNRIGHFVSHTIGIKADFLGDFAPLLIFSRTRFTHNTARNTDHRRPRRNFFGHHGIGADTGVFTDDYRPQHFGAGTDHHAILQGRVALAFIPGGTTQRHAVIQGAVIADFSSLTNHHAHAMVNKETPANGCSRMNLNAGHPAAEGRQHARQPFKTLAPQPVGHPVMQQSMQPRIGGDHLKGIARCRVTLKYTGNVFTQLSDHSVSPCVLWLVSS